MTDRKLDENHNPNPPELTSPPELRLNRLSLCGECEFYSALKFCTKCNCFMPVKTYWIKAKCPESKW